VGGPINRGNTKGKNVSESDSRHANFSRGEKCATSGALIPEAAGGAQKNL